MVRSSERQGLGIARQRHAKQMSGEHLGWIIKPYTISK